MTWTVRRWHKWLAVAVSLVLVMWCVSGISLGLPGGTVARRPSPEPDWSAAHIAPATAARAAATLLGDSALRPQSVQLRLLLGAPVYTVSVRGGGVAFVDATTGEAYLMDAALATRIAERAYGGTARSAQRVDRYGPTYPYGDLPAFVVTFEEGGPRAYVSARSGGVVLATLAGRVRQGLGALHDGRIIAVVLGERPALLFIAGFGSLTLAAALSGLWLALPARWRRRERPDA
jgi:hypothetical protein